MTVDTTCRTTRIAELNDRCRLGLDRTAKHMFTRNCLATFAGDRTADGVIAMAKLLKLVRDYEFKPGDGPERDYGSFEFQGEKLCFKIDCYDLDLDYGSEDPADASITRRVMTVMLTSDY